MTEPWNPFPDCAPEDQGAAVDLVRFQWNPKLHPRNPLGPGGGRFKSIVDPVKRRAAMANSKLVPVREAAGKKLTVGARKKDAPLASFIERRKAPKLGKGEKYVRLQGEKDYEGGILGAAVKGARGKLRQDGAGRAYEIKRRLATVRDDDNPLSAVFRDTKKGKTSAGIDTERTDRSNGSFQDALDFRVPKGHKRQTVQDRFNIEDAKPAKIPGERSREQLAGGRMAQRVDRVTRADGSQLVHKIGDNQSTDSEVLSSRVADAIGAGTEVPRATRVGRNQHTLPFVQGRTMLERGQEFMTWNADKERKFLESKEAHRIGAMDFLTGNGDRNLGNIMVPKNDAHPIAIDQGEAFQIDTILPGDDDNVPSNPTFQLFTYNMFKGMDSGQDLGFDPRDWTADLAAMRDDFDDVGRGDWHDQMMARHEMLVGYYESALDKRTKTQAQGEALKAWMKNAQDWAEKNGAPAAPADFKKRNDELGDMPKPPPPVDAKVLKREADARKFDEDAKAFGNGELKVRNSADLAGGATNKGVRRIELENGRTIVEKQTDIPNEPERQQFISNHLAEVVGVKEPRAYQPAKGRLVMDMAEGVNGEAMTEAERNLAMGRPEFKEQALRIGAMDLISGNPDRHEGNWFWDENTRQMMSIDSALGFQPNRFGPKDIAAMSGGAGPWAKNALKQIPVEDWEKMRDDLKSMTALDSKHKSYRDIAVANINSILRYKNTGSWNKSKPSAELAREVSGGYNWGMFVVDLARKPWDPDLHPKSPFTGQFIKLSDSRRGWGDDPYIDPAVDEWRPDASARRAAEGLPGDATHPHRTQHNETYHREVARERNDRHVEAIDEYNERFWRAAGIEDHEGNAGRAGESWHNGRGADAQFRMAVVDAAPEGQKNRLREIVHSEDFEDADLRMDLNEADTREEAAQAVLTRAFKMWERQHGTPNEQNDGSEEWFASEIRPRERDASGDDGPDLPPNPDMSEMEDDEGNSELSMRHSIRLLEGSAQRARLAGNIETALTIERNIEIANRDLEALIEHNEALARAHVYDDNFEWDSWGR